ncbi:MAG: Lrp/AsnC family transcriptional regulator [Gemmatimonadota bacterium]|nr:Lrp/AsnC family transcriptional regulator [Gemmatimonadota bacterium]
MTYRDLDVRLLDALREDARQSARQLAERLAVSPSTVANRMRDLQERGVLTGFRPEIDYRKLGYGLVAITKIKARGDALPGIVEALSRDRRLTHVYEITGDFDVLVIGRFRDESEMNVEIKRMLGLPGIEGTSTSIVLSAAKDGVDIPLHNPEGTEPGE